MDSIFCQKCKEEIPSTAINCPLCGSVIVKPVQSQLLQRQLLKSKLLGDNKQGTNPKTVILKKNDNLRLIAIVLAIFFGSFGVHRFFLALKNEEKRKFNIYLGVLYLLLSWSGVSSVCAFFDWMSWIVGGSKKFYEKYPSA